MKKDWLYIISPCIIVSVIPVLAIIIGYVEGGWSMLLVTIFFPVLLALIFLDFLVKAVVNKIIKGDLFYLWLIEIVLIGVAFYCFKNYI